MSKGVNDMESDSFNDSGRDSPNDSGSDIQNDIGSDSQNDSDADSVLYITDMTGFQENTYKVIANELNNISDHVT